MTAPTLIIGLGGIGSEIVGMVERKAIASGMDSPNVKYILIDTDEHALQERKKNGFTGLTIRISNNITVEQCLKMNSFAREGWYPDNTIFMNKTLTDGAGQVRAISRLALEHAISQEMLKPLEQVIFELHYMQRNTESRTQRAALVSSLAGGTGSGLLLPFAAWLADYLKRNFPQNGYNMNGFFMMPDVVMHYGNGNNVEGMSLYSNAYAAVKELDYYTQLNAGTIEKREGLRLSEFADFSGTLYNFNFLFGLFNDNCGSAEGLRSLNGYKEMIADCIYLPYCSPVNERNTSWEDNKFKHLTIMLSKSEDKKYRHFGSIGVARLQYPYRKVREYLTLRWAKDTMENDWFYYDTEYYRHVEEYARQEKLGVSAGPMKTLREHYAETVRLANRPLSVRILDSLEKREEGGPAELAWERYLGEMEGYITGQIDAVIERDMSVLYKSMRILRGSLMERSVKNLFADSLARRYLGGLQNVFLKKYTELIRCCSQAQREKKRLAEEVLRPRFLDKEVKEKYCLEYWLQHGLSGQTLHPNAVRYFLFCVQRELEKRIALLESEIKIDKGKILSIQESCLGCSKKDLLDTIEEISGLSGLPAKQTRNEVLCYCYMQVLERVSRLCRAYEQMFDSYRKGLDQLDERLHAVLGELGRCEGTRVKLLCNEEDYLESAYQEMRADVPDYFGALDKVAAYMFRTAEEWKADREKPGARSSVWERLIREWESNFQQAYGEAYDIDVISAAERQVRFLKGRTDVREGGEDAAVGFEIAEMLRYCADRLSAPFLNVSGVPEKEIIKENYFHTSLLDLKGMKRMLVEEELIGKNGVWEDKAIDKYTICYYQSLFGVHANHLDAFKGADAEEAGICYKAYDDITKRMHLNRNVNQVLTPHLDRNWHKAGVLPEMSGELQERREREEWMALIYGFLAARIVRTESGKYRLSEAVFEHKDFASLAEVMELIRDFREEKDAINEARKKEFEEFFTSFGAQEGYEGSRFIRRYKSTALIGDICMPYMRTVRRHEHQRKEIQAFVSAWEEILREYFSMFEIRYEGKIEEYRKLQVDMSPELAEGFLPETSLDQEVIEMLKLELQKRERQVRV